MISMVIVLMLGWWYSRGWLWIIEATEQRLQTVSQVFAVKVLLRTWFSPWKQIYSPSTFTTFFRNLVDNAVSRCIGVVVRGSILFCALILSLLILFIGLVSFIVWPLVPLLILILPIMSLSGRAL